MSCPKTEHLMTEYFADELPLRTREEINRHVQGCEDCRRELDLLLAARDQIGGWYEQRVPHWDRGITQFRRDHGVQVSGGRLGRWWQWLPTAVSFAMLALVAFNLTITSTANGFSVSFGGAAVSQDSIALEQRLAAFAGEQDQRQQAELQAFLARMDERQDSNNLRLMQAVLEQTNQLTGENFDRMYTYFEQQRQQDLQSVQAGYQQLADSDYQTLQNVQQLANLVRYQGDIR